MPRHGLRNASYTLISFLMLFLVFGFSYAANAAESREKTKPGDYNFSMEFGGLERTYILHVPKGYDELDPMPLVIALHGGGANATHMLKISGLNAKADEKGFLAAYPNGAGKNKDFLLTWNAGSCCAYAVENKIDDVGFIKALIKELEARYKIDPKRIYATGFSNGAMLTYRLGCEAPELFAAIAPVAGVISVPDCKPSRPLSVIIFHGTEDQNVPYYGGVGKKALVKEDRKPTSYAFEFWAKVNGCSGPRREEKGKVIVQGFSRCMDSNDAALYTIEGGGHSWPGGIRVYAVEDMPSTAISATDVVWDFFANHPKK